jgi:hypothetical protein
MSISRLLLAGLFLTYPHSITPQPDQDFKQSLVFKFVDSCFVVVVFVVVVGALSRRVCAVMCCRKIFVFSFCFEFQVDSNRFDLSWLQTFLFCFERNSEKG